MGSATLEGRRVQLENAQDNRKSRQTNKEARDALDDSHTQACAGVDLHIYIYIYLYILLYLALARTSFMQHLAVYAIALYKT